MFKNLSIINLVGVNERRHKMYIMINVYIYIFVCSFSEELLDMFEYQFNLV